MGTPKPQEIELENLMYHDVSFVFTATCHKTGVRLNREEVFDVEEDNDHDDEYFRKFNLYGNVYNGGVGDRSLDEEKSDGDIQVVDEIQNEDRLTGSDEKDGNRIQGDIEIQGGNRLTVSVGSLAAPTESVGYGNTTTEGLGFSERREAPSESKGSDMLDGKVVGGIATLTSVQKGDVTLDVQDERMGEMRDDKCDSAVNLSAPKLFGLKIFMVMQGEGRTDSLVLIERGERQEVDVDTERKTVKGLRLLQKRDSGESYRLWTQKRNADELDVHESGVVRGVWC
eukprot:gene3028-5937_t